MLSGAYQHEISGYKLRERELARMRDEAASIIAQVQKALSQTLGDKVRRRGDDAYIDLDLHFEMDADALSLTGERGALEKACSIIKKALDDLPEDQRKDIELFIEGHSDNQQPKNVTNERDRFRYNWDLSSRRATSVLHIFQMCGLKAPEYAILALGYADSEPDPTCPDGTDCNARNRRTTLRLRANTQRIEARLSSVGAETRR